MSIISVYCLFTSDNFHFCTKFNAKFSAGKLQTFLKLMYYIMNPTVYCVNEIQSFVKAAYDKVFKNLQVSTDGSIIYTSF